jgi:hypothetical protein
LERVELGGNQLRALDASEHPALIYLDVSDNRLSSLEVIGCGRLRQLRASSNELQQLSLRGLGALCELAVSDNELLTLDLQGLGELAELRVANNPLRQLDLRPCRELCRLSIRGDREGPVAELLATDAQRHRLAELRSRFGLATGADQLAAMNAWELHDHALDTLGRPDAEKVLLDVVSQPHCDRGTALLVYWASSPHYYLRYASRDELEPYEQPGWDLLRAIEQREAGEGFPTDQIWFDPRNDKQVRSVTGFDFTRDPTRVPASRKRSIPAPLCRPSRAAV